ncbi:uncharacterized protein LOC112271637 [Brachypodium distachyon]|uniref:uncharacterized protein LOC112271637 n=1 Tax=Brachypodium distachyon TaxID=15368 RepID=UPI000D0DAABB|nr:uncharacterized protein LOC112271637 [Brachypodium distachyon]|eukprot:XP_024317128.1 uncharacterized protein LOC112271637 [Brachypodium distachyon]
MSVGTIMESRDVTFFENIFPMRDMHSTSREDHDIPAKHDSSKEHQDHDVDPEPTIPIENLEQILAEIPEEDDNEAPTRSKRQRIAKSFGDDFIVYLVEDTPKIINEAFASPDADCWKEAIRSEMDSIMANADVILNIKLVRDNNGEITLLLSHYVERILSRFGYADCKPSPTPYDPSVLLRKNHRIGRYQLRYSQIIGSLMYPKVLEGYSDSNWISDVDELKATSGYVFTLGGGAVS